jgi:hypothetical protein
MWVNAGQSADAFNKSRQMPAFGDFAMTKPFLAALLAASVLIPGATYAGGITAPAMTPSVGSQTIIGVAGGEAYPQFGPATAPITSRAMTALNGEQYPRFNGPRGPVSTQRMMAQNGQNYPEFAAPPDQQNHAYAQAVQPPAAPTRQGAGRA